MTVESVSCVMRTNQWIAISFTLLFSSPFIWTPFICKSTKRINQSISRDNEKISFIIIKCITRDVK